MRKLKLYKSMRKKKDRTNRKHEVLFEKIIVNIFFEKDQLILKCQELNSIMSACV